MLMITFRVDGTPVPKGRPRFARRGKFVSTYTDKSTLQYEDLIADSAKRAMGSSEPFVTPLEAFFYFSFPIPKSYLKNALNRV
jgi:Holliday junction resolvase RusA-like endonuclease